MNRKKAFAPCEYYFGNVCSGFGGELVCLMCGWERHDHEEHEDDWLKGLYVKD